MIAPAAVLSIKGLAVRFGGLTAIDDMSFEVRDGEVLSLIGPNGAGKTTAFNAITGYLAPAAGDIVYRAQRLNGLKVHQIAALGLVRTFQKTSVFGGRTVLDNILIGLHKRGRQRPLAIILGLPSVSREEQELRAAAWDVLRFVGIERRVHRRIGDGKRPRRREQKRQHESSRHARSSDHGGIAEVAIALAAEPKLLLLDEPVSGMNPAEKADFMKMLGAIRARGITILLVEHDMRTVMDISDRVVVLNQGRIIADDVPSEIQRNPEVIRAYLGEGYRRAHG